MMMLCRAPARAAAPLAASGASRRPVVAGACAQLAPRAGAQAGRRAVAMRAGGEEQAPANSTQVQQQEAPQQQPQQPPEDLPIWVRREKERELQAASKGELPWPLYLLFSTFVAIASVGSVFEYFDRNPVFGVIQPDSPLWAPILGLFAFTGLPTAGFLFFKGVNAANEAAEKQDRMDGYIK